MVPKADAARIEALARQVVWQALDDFTAGIAEKDLAKLLCCDDGDVAAILKEARAVARGRIPAV